GVDGAVIRRQMVYSDKFPEVLVDIPKRYQDMPYRVLLRLMARRLETTADDDERGYPSARGFIDDLKLIRRSLVENKGEHAGGFRLRRLITRAETFHFHLATLDVRQDAMVHRTVVGQMLGEDHESWMALTPGARADRITQALIGFESPSEGPTEASTKTMRVFEKICDARRRFGDRAIGPYIISMAQTTEDVLAVMLLASWAGLANAEGHVRLDIAPLFETVPDLQNAEATMSVLFGAPLYRDHVRRRRDRQIVMIGYSDSNKEGGLVASRWGIQQAQASLVRVHATHGIHLTFFHGKGGTVSRGGGKMHRAILSAPGGAVDGRLRVTEQGEVINAKYGLRAEAMRNLMLTTAAVLAKTANHRQGKARVVPDAWHTAMTTLATESRGAYRALVYEHPDFVRYFRLATPIDVIERLRMGSRPSSRRKGGGVESLRAIPWVFAWTQSRLILPGWYGLGSGLAACAAKYGEKTLTAMADPETGWPFFRTLLEDVEVVLAKVDLVMAKRYAALAGSAGERLFPEIRAEFDRTYTRVLGLLGVSTPLENDAESQRSIALRNPYVDPMSLLQLQLLERWRATNCEDETLENALLITLNGISHGLRETG
ncbi:MAG: phosphoenolpyruvate carboxylase, partial [Myxococcota bacterium]